MFGLFALFKEQPVPPPTGDEVFAFLQLFRDFIMANGATSFAGLAVIFVGAFSILASFTKNEADNKIADALWKVINLLGFNFGKAKNK